MTSRTSFALLALLCAIATPRPAAAKVANWTKVTQPQPGIELREGRTTTNTNNIYAALISLCSARVHPTATAKPTSRKTAGSWATSVGAQLAVNGDFYQASSPPSVYGDAVGGGVHWPASQIGTDDTGSWYYRSNGWIAFGKGWAEFSHTKHVKNNAATLGIVDGWKPATVTTAIPAGTLALVSGFPELVIEGQPYTCSSPTASSCFPDRSDMRARHPRTAMGLTQDRKTLILAVVDGRSTASKGMYGTELAALMHELGAWVAFNLDGGGSSQIWVQGRGTINDPSDGSPRAVANHWGVFAGTAGGKSATPGSCLVAGGCYPAPVPGAETATFRDMPVGSTGETMAVLLHNKQIAAGCQTKPRALFCPNCTITRRQLMAWLVRAAGIDTSSPPTVASFGDVPQSAPDFALIEAGLAAGITNGCGNGKFCPDEIVTRATAAAFISRAAGLPGAKPGTPSFADVPTTHTFYEGIEALAASCVTNGCGAGKYCPDDALDRAHAAILVVRAFNLDGNNKCLGSATTDAGVGLDAGIPGSEPAPGDAATGTWSTPGPDGGHGVTATAPDVGGGCTVTGSSAAADGCDVAWPALLLALWVSWAGRRRRHRRNPARSVRAKSTTCGRSR